MEAISGRSYIPGRPVDFSKFLNISDKLKQVETPVDMDTWVTIDENTSKNNLMRRYQPIAQMSHPKMAKLNEDIKISAESAIRDFYSGTMSEDALKAKFQELADKNMQATHEYVNYGLTDKVMETCMMESFYGEFRRMALDVAVRMNNEEGKQYVTGDPGSQDWKYYNSDYYHKSEAAIGAITEGITELAQEYGHETFEVPDYKAKERWLCHYFNTAYSNPMVATDQTFLDRDAVPPEGLVWFSQQGTSDNSRVTAVLVEDYEASTKFDVNNFLTATAWASLRGPDGTTHRVGTDIIYDYSKADKNNLGRLFQFSGSSKQVSAANDFLSQLQVYRRGYFSDMYSNHRFETLA